MIDYQAFFNDIEFNRLQPLAAAFQQALDERYFQRIQGDHPIWQAAFDALPELTADAIDLTHATVSATHSVAISEAEQHALSTALQGLHPWRKGPFDLFGTHIDTEWRSDWKWQRLASHISNLNDRVVLDVGCGSGYHCWRMRGAGAKFVLGIDPSQKFLYQFHAIKKYLGAQPVHYLPLRSEDLPPNSGVFDTVFSMGVLYHRKSPFDHLEELKAALRSGGELVLETLVLAGEDSQVLVPSDRYAQMRNVWFIPTAHLLAQWPGTSRIL